MKQLSEMNTAELGQLFPIAISEPNTEWKSIFQKEYALIHGSTDKSSIISIDHIGSTAVPNLPAKPIIDILIQVADNFDHQKLVNNLQSINYHYIPKPENPAPHMLFVKGYTLEGFKGQAFHIHIRYKGIWNELKFRDILIQNPAIASQYSELKFLLANKHKFDREAYTNSKSDFIMKILDSYS